VDLDVAGIETLSADLCGFLEGLLDDAQRATGAAVVINDELTARVHVIIISLPVAERERHPRPCSF
jgi:hypothetical protein